LSWIVNIVKSSPFDQMGIDEALTQLMLNSFNFGRPQKTMNLNLNVSGEVDVRGVNGSHTERIACQTIGAQVSGSVDGFIKGFR
jgi:hypothetical protein